MSEHEPSPDLARLLSRLREDDSLADEAAPRGISDASIEQVTKTLRRARLGTSMTVGRHRGSGERDLTALLVVDLHGEDPLSLFRAVFWAQHGLLIDGGVSGPDARRMAYEGTSAAFLIGGGWQPAEIARTLGVSERTVRSGLARVRAVRADGRLDAFRGRRLPPVPLPQSRRDSPICPLSLPVSRRSSESQ